MTQLLPKVAAIKEALGIPPDLAALQALETACELLGIVPDPASTLMQMADNLVAAIGCVVAQSPVPAPTPAPTPALTPATAHTPAHAPVNAPAASPATSRKRPAQRPAPQDSASYIDGLTGSLTARAPLSTSKSSTISTRRPPRPYSGWTTMAATRTARGCCWRSALRVVAGPGVRPTAARVATRAVLRSNLESNRGEGSGET